MIDILHGTDWAGLEHAHGPAGDVPAHLAALLGAGPEERTAALHFLYTTVTHQGSVYPATAPAARYVAAILTDERTTPIRADLLEWLDDVAANAVEFAGAEDVEEDPAIDDCYALIPEWYRAVTTQFAHPDPEIRVAARQAAFTMLAAPELTNERPASIPHLTAEPDLLSESLRDLLEETVEEWREQ
ncbi:hypothetical protein [Actinoplanes rectilineatus]|uniref:hypothetical protein n=1 Tax=Actinoplanes rectilineatus TaxID=113571 RepID=UPI000697E6B8|nr:hypothetical protein [Actinoplanes rectilineatus]